MIARVRIAPIERWCERARRKAEGDSRYHLLPGTEIEIDTSMFMLDGERSWYYTQKTRDVLAELWGERRWNGWSTCEHVLEMD